MLYYIYTLQHEKIDAIIKYFYEINLVFNVKEYFLLL